MNDRRLAVPTRRLSKLNFTARGKRANTAPTGPLGLDPPEGMQTEITAPLESTAGDPLEPPKGTAGDHGSPGKTPGSTERGGGDSKVGDVAQHPRHGYRRNPIPSDKTVVHP